MINKQNLWFLTLFSLILVLSVYYITMPNDLLIASSSTDTKEEAKEKDNNTDTTDKNTISEVDEADSLTALRVSLDEERDKEKEELKTTMTKEDATTDEKNNAYEQLKYLSVIEGEEEKLEKLIKEKHKLDSFVKVDNNTITIEDGVISTHVEFNKNYNTLTNKPQINGIELSGNKTLTELGVQPAGNYLTSIPAEYVTNSELNAKGYLTSIPSEYITETELNGKGYLTGIPAEYITETELNGKGYLTSVPEGYVQNSDLAQVAISGSYNDLEDKPTIPTPYILPTASTNVLGGVKVDGTSITITDGVIKASSTSVPIATTDVAGIIKPNSLTFEVSEDGTLTDKSAGSNCYIYGLKGIGTDDITNSTGTTTVMPVGRLRNYDYERGDRLKVGDMLIDLKGNVAKVDRVNTAVCGPSGVSYVTSPNLPS